MKKSCMVVLLGVCLFSAASARADFRIKPHLQLDIELVEDLTNPYATGDRATQPSPTMTVSLEGCSDAECSSVIGQTKWFCARQDERHVLAPRQPSCIPKIVGTTLTDCGEKIRLINRCNFQNVAAFRESSMAWLTEDVYLRLVLQKTRGVGKGRLESNIFQFKGKMSIEQGAPYTVRVDAKGDHLIAKAGKEGAHLWGFE